MRRTDLILPSLAVALCLASAAQATTRVFLLGGQSNMVGTGKLAELKAPYDAPQPDVKVPQTGLGRFPVGTFVGASN